MSVSELEFNYMPSNWSKRYGPVELKARYFKFCEEISKEVRSSIEHERDVSYGSTEKMTYDFYGTNLPKEAPILLFIHGGYWQEFSKDLSGFAVPNFVANDIKVIVGGYDLCPNVSLTEIVKEVKSLVDHVLKLAKEYGSKGVWIAGHSAGAHLAASLIHDPEWLKSARKGGYLENLRGLALISGIYELEPLLRVSVNEALKLTPNEIKEYSFAPFEATNEDDNVETLRNLKVIVTAGEEDSPIFIEESRRYTRRLIKLVDNVEFLLIRDIDHFNIVENLISNDFILSKVLVKNIKNV